MVEAALGPSQVRVVQAAPALPPQGHLGGAPAAPDAGRGAAEQFFDGYLRSLLQLLSSPDAAAAEAAWRVQAHQGFATLVPTGVTTVGADPVLGEWRLCLAYGHYSSAWITNITLQACSAAGAVCGVTLMRSYARRGGQDMSRPMVSLQIHATRLEDGSLAVLWHRYDMVPPSLFRDVASRSQIGQDLWVLQHFGGLARPGFFLEVGANHSEELSNTLLLEKAAGWSGLCVEPFPRGDWSTRGSELVRCAVGPDGKRLRFIAPGHVLGGLLDQVDLPRVTRDVPPDQRPIVEVETRTLGAILRGSDAARRQSPRVVHYMSLDTEGSEFDILMSFPWDEWKMLSITVEHNFQEPQRTRIRQLLESKGMYLDVSVEHDDFYLLTGFEQYL